MISKLFFTLGQHPYTSDFIVHKHLQRPLILCIGCLKQHIFGTRWSNLVVHEGHTYDVQTSQAHITEHHNIVLIPTIHKVDNAFANEIPYIPINLYSNDIHLVSVEMLGLLNRN